MFVNILSDFTNVREFVYTFTNSFQEAMRKIGITERDIYLVKQWGKNFERTNSQLLKRIIWKSDILSIHLLESAAVLQISVGTNNLHLNILTKEKTPLL